MQDNGYNTMRNTPATPQDDGLNDEANMTIALELADEAAEAGEIPVGAVIVDDTGTIIAAARNECEETTDATAHAEILAIRRASELLGSWRLTDCTLYVTLEPCPMCAGAIVNSRLKRLVYGAADSHMGAVESILNIPGHPALGAKLQVRAGVLEEQCRQQMKSFFANRRGAVADTNLD